MLAGLLEQVQRAKHIHIGIVHGLLQRLPHVGLGGLVHHGVEFFGCEELAEFGIADVTLYEASRRVEVVLAARRQIVQHYDAMSCADQGIRNMRADEACAAGNEYFHRASRMNACARR